MEKLLFLTEEEMNQIEGGGFIGWCIGAAGYILEKASERISHSRAISGGPSHYEI